MAEESVVQAMGSDWDERARDDAHYFVAFGRRNQNDEEFFSSAADQIRMFETELKRFPPCHWKHVAALEIGCGPGRLLLPLSRHFGEIHGIDISEEMLQRAERNLHGISNCHLHRSEKSDLSEFSDATIDFVYSYAVFQHIPSKQIVLNYLKDAVRVLRPGGLFVFQINGLPESGHVPTTWEGCRVDAEEIVEFAREHGLLLLALLDRNTQYMWVTLQRMFESEERPRQTEIYKVTNAYSGEPVVPAAGRFGAASVWITHLPKHADLLSLTASVDGVPAQCCYISPLTNGRRFVDVIMPPGTRTGLVPISLHWNGSPLGEEAVAALIPAAPRISSVSYLADGLNRLSAERIESGCIKLVMDEVESPNDLKISIGGRAVPYDSFCINPLHERYEFNFHLPPGLPAGRHSVALQLGGKRFAPIPIEVVNVP